MNKLTDKQVREEANSVYVLKATIVQLQKNLVIKARKLSLTNQ